MVKHKPHTAEYKLSAVQLAQTDGISKIAINLRINTNMINRWKREHETHTAQARPVFPGRGKPALTESKQEIQKLKRELDIARQKRDILKKAVACLGQKAAPCGLGRFFAKETR
jgi:transposase